MMEPLTFHGCAAEYQELSGAILRRTHEVLATGKVLQGPEVAQFESEIAALAGRQHAIAVGSGTDALFFALTAAGIGAGDEVLLPDLSFIASASAIARTGARPVFVDITESCCIDLDKAAHLVARRSRAMIVVQLFGSMADPTGVEAFARTHGLVLIEDYAQSLGATFNGHPCGSAGLAGAVSFDPTKIIGAPGSGGAVVTDDDELAMKVRQLRLHGKQGPDFVIPGYNSQLPSWTAAVLSLKLARNAEWTRRRTATAMRYLAGFRDLPLCHPIRPPEVHHVWHKFTLRFRQRDAMVAHLAAAGIPVMVHYRRALHQESVFASQQHDQDFPVTMAHCSETFSLPIHSHLSDDDVDRVIAAVSSFFG